MRKNEDKNWKTKQQRGSGNQYVQIMFWINHVTGLIDVYSGNNKLDHLYQDIDA